MRCFQKHVLKIFRVDQRELFTLSEKLLYTRLSPPHIKNGATCEFSPLRQTWSNLSRFEQLVRFCLTFHFLCAAGLSEKVCEKFMQWIWSHQSKWGRTTRYNMNIKSDGRQNSATLKYKWYFYHRVWLTKGTILKGRINCTNILGIFYEKCFFKLAAWLSKT